jgi:hypothetical protein
MPGTPGKFRHGGLLALRTLGRFNVAARHREREIDRERERAWAVLHKRGGER